MKHKRFIDLALDAITKAKGFGDCRYTTSATESWLTKHEGPGPQPYCVVGQFAALAGASVKMMFTCTGGPAPTFLREMMEMGQLEQLAETQISLMLTLQHIWDKSYVGVRDEATARDVMFLKLMDHEVEHG